MLTTQKIFKQNHIRALIYLGMIALLWTGVFCLATSVEAAGTAPGAITLEVIVNYNDGGAIGETRDSVTITVIQVAGAEVTPSEDFESIVKRPGQTVEYEITIKNTGNDEDTFSLDVLGLEGWSSEIQDSEGNAIDSVTLAADAEQTVTVIITAPETAVDGDQRFLNLRATSEFDEFVSVQSGIMHIIVVGEGSDILTTEVGEVIYVYPEEEVTYTLTITNTSWADLTGLTITHPIPNNITFKQDSIVLSGDEAAGCFAIFVAGIPNSINVNCEDNRFSAGGLLTLEFTAIVDKYAPPGERTGTAIINYTDAAGVENEVSVPIQAVIVKELRNIKVTIEPEEFSGKPGEIKSAEITVQNEGNVIDDYQIDLINLSEKLTWSLICGDVQGDSVNTGLISPSETGTCSVEVQIPGGIEDGHEDEVMFTIISADGVSSWDKDTDPSVPTISFTIQAPVITVTLQAWDLEMTAQVTDVKPGDQLVMVVTVTNTGAAEAKDLKLMAPIPDGLEYVPGTITISEIMMSDADGDDAGVYDAANNRVEIGPINMVNGESMIFTYRVKVSDGN